MKKEMILIGATVMLTACHETQTDFSNCSNGMHVSRIEKNGEFFDATKSCMIDLGYEVIGKTDEPKGYKKTIWYWLSFRRWKLL
jgi:hypothetical protein